jgi:phosphatidylserine/phosphatidylglycerophosphate/cardiolipin synthase-like enzyme
MWAASPAQRPTSGAHLVPAQLGGMGMTTFLRSIALAAWLLGASLLSHAAPSVQVGFSPEGSARQLVLETIAGAQQSIHILAYAFQAPDIMQALVDAKNRGVEVRVVVDKKRNRGKTSRKAMDFVTRNGVELRTNDHFHIHHDKTIIVDGHTVQTGSFNFAPSAETMNSENVVVIRGMPEVSSQYMAHWQSRWKLGKPYPAQP